LPLLAIRPMLEMSGTTIILILREVSTDDGIAKAKDLGIMFVETSAKLNTGINELFTNIVQTLVGDEDTNEFESKGTKPYVPPTEVIHKE